MGPAAAGGRVSDTCVVAESRHGLGKRGRRRPTAEVRTAGEVVNHGDPPDSAGSPGPSVVTGLGRGMVWRYTQAAAAAAASLFTAGYALRHLGAADYGIFALALSVSAFLALLDFGLSLTVVRAAAIEHAGGGTAQHHSREDIWAAHAAYFALGGVAMAVVVGLAAFLPGLFPRSGSSPGEVRVTVLLVGMSVAVFLGTSAFNGMAYGRRNFAVITGAITAGAAANVLCVVLLTPRLGLPSLAIGQLASVVVNRLILAAWLRRNVSWFRLRPSRPSWAGILRVSRSALPLLIVSIGGQFIATTDLVLLGFLTTAASVGLYRVGSVIPFQAVNVLYQGYDVVFPSLAATTDLRAQEDAARFLTRVAAYVAAIAFGVMAFLRNDIVALLVGHSSPLAANVLAIFCAVWLVNVSVHGLALLLIARGLQRLQARLVIVEIVVNLSLTVVMVETLGPVGGAIASLAAVLFSHWVLLPWKVDKELREPLGSTMLRDALLATAVGLAVAALPCAAVAPLSPSLPRMLLGGLLAVVTAAVTGAALLRRQGRQRLIVMLRRTETATAPSNARGDPV